MELFDSPHESSIEAGHTLRYLSVHLSECWANLTDMFGVFQVDEDSAVQMLSHT